MSESNVRLGDDPVVHGATSGGWTTCGVMYSSPIHGEAIRFMHATPTGDLIDCMACLVQETRGPIETLTVRATMTLPVDIYMVRTTYAVNLEPEE